ncbi:Thioredoxin reductase [Liberibacter crescens BT-1]|uniref:Thioredoxin reductase n=1 Tax=Liberibacter crescens (strain BT-1) TaxID=1215343 RepID=L0EWC1_LIBCB|nr:thioredoxin-disulfide reductase [Liberibacter crescens]AGA64953.1 Thioredoxin reductase [Liberibacter crescens BT-1]AMC12974.1 thioredoxin reductase [Liberibacter crescens]
MNARHTKVLIIGSGPAGYTAAIYSARAMLNPILISGIDPGGQLMMTESVENYPGFAHLIQGSWLMEQMQLQAESFGTQIVRDNVKSTNFKDNPFIIETDSGEILFSDSLIIATGAKAKWIGLEGEKTFQGFGVSACATCDGFFYRNKNVLVVGGGNTAVEEALYLSNLARKVTVVHRQSSLKAEKILQERLFSKSNIDIIWDTELIEIVGLVPDRPRLPFVSSVRLCNKITKEISEIPIDGVFVAIGHKPETGIFDGKLKFKNNGYIWTAPDSTATSVPGVFAAGDVTDDVYRQAITAAAMGCMAALEVERYLSGVKINGEEVKG